MHSHVAILSISVNSARLFPTCNASHRLHCQPQARSIAMSENLSGQVLHRAPEISTTQLQPGSSLALQYSLRRSFETLTVANWPLARAPSPVSPQAAYIGQSVTKWTRPVVESQASNSHADVVFPSNRRFGWKEGLDPRIGAGRVLSGRPGGIVTLRKWRRAGTGLDVHELHAYRPTLGYPYLGS
jgi:hypothetical protein